VTADQLPGFGPSRATPPGRRLLARALTRPSLAALVALAVIVLVFSLRAPGLLSWDGLAAILDTAAILGIGGVAVALLLIAGHFDLSIGAVAVGSALVSALLVGNAGWGTWPALGVSLLCALVVGLVNGLLVVSTGMPSFLATLATFLVLEGGTLVGAHRMMGGATVQGLGPSPGWRSADAVFDSTVVLGDGTFRVCCGGSARRPWPRGSCGARASATPSSPAAAPAARPVSSASPSGGPRWCCSA
jgi:simple sugar transport system permease protein